MNFIKKTVLLATPLLLLPLFTGCNSATNDNPPSTQCEPIAEINESNKQTEPQPDPTPKNDPDNKVSEALKPGENKINNDQNTKSNSKVTSKNNVLDLSGKWKQIDSESETIYQTAIIEKGTIEIFWINPKEESKALYWSGTYSKPNSDCTNYSWDSKSNTEKTKNALLASRDSSKKFSYNNGIISYEVTALGVTRNVKMKRVD